MDEYQKAAVENAVKANRRQMDESKAVANQYKTPHFNQAEQGEPCCDETQGVKETTFSAVDRLLEHIAHTRDNHRRILKAMDEEAMHITGLETLIQIHALRLRPGSMAERAFAALINAYLDRAGVRGRF